MESGQFLSFSGPVNVHVLRAYEGTGLEIEPPRSSQLPTTGTGARCRQVSLPPLQKWRPCTVTPQEAVGGHRLSFDDEYDSHKRVGGRSMWAGAWGQDSQQPIDRLRRAPMVRASGRHDGPRLEAVSPSTAHPPPGTRSSWVARQRCPAPRWEGAGHCLVW